MKVMFQCVGCRAIVEMKADAYSRKALGCAKCGNPMIKIRVPKEPKGGSNAKEEKHTPKSPDSHQEGKNKGRQFHGFRSAQKAFKKHLRGR